MVYIPKYNLICKICGEPFKSVMPFSKYCNKKCKRKAAYISEYIPHPYKLTFVNCSYCGKKIKKLPSAIKYSKSGKLYCNKSCKAKSEFKKDQIKCYCHNCGKEMDRRPSEFTKNGKLSREIFCSRKCWGIFLRQFTKEKSFNWKGGYDTTERERIRARKAWKE